jgi:hypothetical protein
MLLILASIALQKAALQGPETGGQKNTLLGIYRELSQKSQKSNGFETSSILFSSVGYSEWSVNDGGLGGVPCKIYKADGMWSYEQKDPKRGVDHHTASFRSAAYIGLDGVPITTESDFHDDCEFKKNVDIHVLTRYFKDHYRSTVTRNGKQNVLEMWPKFGMEKFGGMQAPMILDGLVQAKSRKGAFIHPYTGIPVEFDIEIGGRFRGSYFFEPQEGYFVDITSGSGTQRAYVTRQGQMIKIDLGNKYDASLQVGMMRKEWEGWGKFDLGNWDLPTSEANPNRPHFKAIGMPILIDNPRLLILVPCVVAL